MNTTIFGLSLVSFPFSYTPTLSNRAGVYAIINNSNGKFYIGSSNNMLKRINQHKYELNKNSHHNDYLNNAFQLERDWFQFVCIEQTELYRELEQTLLDSLFDNRQQCYNLSTNAKHPSFTQHTRNKIRNNMIALHAKDTNRRQHLIKYNQTEFAKRQQSVLAKQQRKDPNYVKNLAACVSQAKQKYYDVWLISPQNEKCFIGWNLAAFCKKHDLNPANLHKVLNKRAKSHKGWKLS